jgi:hypothetical protein
MKREIRNKIAMLLLGWVAIFFASCEKEISDRAEGDIRVHFTLGDLSYGENETLTRGAKVPASETVAVSVGGGLHMYAMLQEDAESALRAPVAIPPGTRLVIVAYKSGGGGSYTYEGDAEYEVTAGGIEPVGSVTGLTLSSFGIYNFVAYSLHTGLVPSYGAAASSYSPDGSDDPLWGETGDENIDSNDNDLSIVMRHVFSKVKMSVATTNLSATPPVISSPITAAIVGCEADLQDGHFSKGTVGDQSFTWPAFTTATSIVSNERTVYTGGEPTASIKITSVTVGGTEYSVVAGFNMPLLSGRTYTLAVDFKKIVWAGSNIYWKDQPDSYSFDYPGYLTFDAPETDVHAENQRKTGVFFKWGSLVGMMPNNIWADSQSIKYLRPVCRPSFTSKSQRSWVKTSAYHYDVDYVDDDVTGDMYSTYLRDDARNTDNDYAYWKARKGDICRYISENGYGPGDGNYRMPTAYELGATSNNSSGWVQVGGWTNEDPGESSTYVHDNYTFHTDATVSFPAAGFVWTSTLYREAGYSLIYGTCSVAGNGNPLLFSALSIVTHLTRAVGFSVRCIRN